MRERVAREQVTEFIVYQRDRHGIDEQKRYAQHDGRERNRKNSEPFPERKARSNSFDGAERAVSEARSHAREKEKHTEENPIQVVSQSVFGK
jgi:hypothetical protein